MTLTVAFVGFFALSLTLGSAENCKNVGFDSLVSQASHKGKCYVFFNTPDYIRPYHTAAKKCQSFKGTLAMPKTQDVNDFLLQQLQAQNLDKPYWIGLDDFEKEGTFVWADGSEWDKDVLDMFGDTEGPRFAYVQHHVEDCVAINNVNGTWHDYVCNPAKLSYYFQKRLNFVCEFNMEATTATSV